MSIFRRASPVDPTKSAICGCGHHLALHDLQNRSCGHIEVVYNTCDEVVRDSGDDPVLDCHGFVQTIRSRVFASTVPCGCRHYIGPEPLSSVVATPLFIPPAER
ncbi:hypothetical protein [Nocardia brasiliensis]|uniref:hypothetical protein n=1 Tax=Nocardia brasiliensis TaxID=37326 RepID=UPI0024551A52|nr:hypothetical protein [Nocardia brasiliensis]